MKTITETYEVYTFDELSDSAKQTAVQEYSLDYEWWDYIYEDFKEICKIIGIEVTDIYFSGFSSQGDGAMFEGYYSYEKGSVASLIEFAPNEDEPIRIAKTLQAIQKKYFYSLAANVKHSGHYYHQYSNTIDCEVLDYHFINYQELSSNDEDDLKELLRDLMVWLYGRLESEYDYLTGEESIKEMAEANEWYYDENGRII